MKGIQMKVSCNIIRDILPLYAEDMVCEETRELVEEHLCGCDECTKELGRLKKKEAIPVSADTAPMEHIRKSIRKRQILTTVCVVLTIASLIWSGVVFMISPIYLPVEKAIKGVSLREDGTLDFYYAKGIMGRGTRTASDGDRYQCATATRYNWIKGKAEERKFQAMTEEEQEAYLREVYDLDEVTKEDLERFLGHDVATYCKNEKGELREEKYLMLGKDGEQTWTKATPDFDIWYLSADGKPETLLWNGGDGVYPEEDMDMGKNSGETFVKRVFWGSLAAFALFMGADYFLRNSKWKKLFLVIGVCAASVAVYVLLFTSGNFSDLIGIRLPYWDNHVISTSFLLTATTLLWFYRHEQNKKESF